LAIITFAILVKVITFPLMLQQLRSSKAMQELQPKMQELQKKYGKDKEKLSQEQMKLYKEAGVNPLGGCLPLLIQLPILWGLYQALYNLSQTQAFKEASQFLWLRNLADPEPFPYILIALMVVSQYVYQRMSTLPSTDPQQKSMNQIMQFMPLMFAFFFINFPAGLVLYWVAMNVVSIVQQYFVTGWGGLLPQRATASAGNKDKSKADVKKKR
jgi:YidC/Oxa1 family membrane protein insertase